MKYFKKLFIFICMIAVLCGFTGYNVYANDFKENLTLHEKTKIYSKNNDDYFLGCNDKDDYLTKGPAITVLTPGYGGDASHWSNDTTGGFAQNDSSLVNKIAEKNNYNIDIYLASCKKDGSFTLTKYDSKLKNQKKVTRINDVSKHIIVLFESSEPKRSNQYVYEEFENVVDTISYQYYSLVGELPKLNLVGHSRGGLTNIMYATDHPYNVVSVFSLGTPYSGSTLGEVDYVLDLLYKNEKENEGIQDILSEEEARRIRDRWNEAYKPDVTCSVIALGSITSVDYLSLFVEELENSQYKDEINKYKKIIDFVLMFIKSNPNLSANVINLAEFGISVKQFAYDVEGVLLGISKCFRCFMDESHKEDLDNWIKNYDEKLTEMEELDDVKKALDLYAVIDGRGVLLDDLFIDVNSQLGYFSSEDENDFNGFHRYAKIFDVNDIINSDTGEFIKNRSMPTEPAVVHNMEAFNPTFTELISSNLSYWHFDGQVTTLKDFESFSDMVEYEKVIEFKPLASGTRHFSVTCDYSICDEFGNKIDVVEDEVYLNADKIYFIVLQPNSETMVDLKIDVTQNFKDALNFGEKDKIIGYFTGLSKGYHVLASSNYDSEYYDLNGNQIGYVYSNKESEKHYFIVKSVGNKVNLYTKNSYEIIPDGKYYGFDHMNLLSLKNEYDMPLNYELTTENCVKIEIYDDNHSVVSSSILYEEETEKYTISLEPQQVVYVFILEGGNIKVSLAGSQLFWFVDDEMITNGNEYGVEAGKEYDIALKLQNGEEYKPLKFSYELNNNYLGVYIKNKKLIVDSDKALIGREVSIRHSDYLSSLQLHIMPPRCLNLEVQNSDTITLKWSIRDSHDYGIVNQITTIIFSIKSGSYEEEVKLDGCLDTIVQLDSLKKINYVVTLVSVVFNNDSSFGNKTTIYDSSFFDFESKEYNSYYADYQNSEPNHYYISCLRHLKNIEKNPSGRFKLINDISVGEWKSNISFSGRFDGQGHTLYDLNIIKGDFTQNLGLFHTNSGAIVNLNINRAYINSNNSATFAGVITGHNDGKIADCYISNAKIIVPTTCRIHEKASDGACVGGLAGFNAGSIKDSKISWLTMEVSGNAGGITGINKGTVRNCITAEALIKYIYHKLDSGKYEEYNGRVGGIVGYNCGSVRECLSSGDFYWTNEDANRDIYPCLGTIVGSNATTARDNTSSMKTHLNYKSSWWAHYDQSGRCFKIDDGMIGFQE